MNTTPRVMARVVETDTRTSYVRGTSSPTTSRDGPALPCSGSHQRESHPLCPIRHTSTRESGKWAPGHGNQRPGIRGDRIAVMLVHPWDAPNNDDEWRAVLRDFDF